jgi:hypothetical protein
MATDTTALWKTNAKKAKDGGIDVSEFDKIEPFMKEFDAYEANIDALLAAQPGVEKALADPELASSNMVESFRGLQGTTDAQRKKLVPQVAKYQKTMTALSTKHKKDDKKKKLLAGLIAPMNTFEARLGPNAALTFDTYSIKPTKDGAKTFDENFGAIPAAPSPGPSCPEQFKKFLEAGTKARLPISKLSGTDNFIAGMRQFGKLVDELRAERPAAEKGDDPNATEAFKKKQATAQALSDALGKVVNKYTLVWGKWDDDAADYPRVVELVREMWRALNICSAWVGSNTALKPLGTRPAPREEQQANEDEGEDLYQNTKDEDARPRASSQAAPTGRRNTV